MDSHFGTAWQVVVAAAAEATRLPEPPRSAGFALNPAGDLRSVPTDDPTAVLIWQPGRGWEATIPPDDPRRPGGGGALAGAGGRGGRRDRDD
jgi:hypothetical protein